MGFEVGKQVTSSNTSISRESFEKQEGINKLKKEELNAVWDRFDMNNDGQLDQDEQVGLMAFLKNLAATDEGKDDDKLTRKEVRHARNDKDNILNSFGDNVKLSYKDIKRVSNAFNNLVGNTGTEVQRKDAETFTAGQNSYIINEESGTVKSKTTKTGTTTNYDYDENNDIEKKTTTEGEGNNKKVTTTEYQNFEGVKIKKKEVATVGTDEDKTVTTTEYTGITKNGKPEAGKTQEKMVHGDTERTTDFDPNTGFKKQETIEHKDTKEKTVDKFDNKGGLANRTKTKNGKLVTYTTYTPGGATETLYDETGNNITKEITYSNYNHQNGAVIDRTKTQETIYEKGKKTTTTYKDGKKNISTTTSDNGNIVTTTFKDGKEATTTTKYKDGKTVTHDRGKRQLTVKTKEGKTTTVSTDENGGIATFPKFNGKRMETAGEAADRLGLKGAAKDAFVKKYGGEKAVLKAGTKLEVPNDAASDKDFKIDNVEVNGAAEAEKLKKYQAIQRQMAEIARLEAIAREQRCGANYAKSADNAIANWDKKGSTRATYATDEYRVFCDQQYNRGGSHKAAEGKDFQQHYIYSTYYNRMVKVEDLAGNIPKGEHVTWMSATGTAKLTNGKTIQLALDDNKIHGKKTIGGFSADSPQAKAYIEQLKARLAQEQKDFDKMVNQDKIGSSYVSTEQFETQVSSQGKTLAGVAEEEAARQAETARTTSQNYITGAADDIWTPADGWGGGDDAVRDMSYTIRSRITTDNVVEIYETYQKRHTADTSMIDTMTSESIGISDVGSRGGREHAYKATEHIINKLQDRALKAGVEKSTIDRIRSSFDHVNWFYYYTVNDMDDDKLTEVAQPVISQLITEIKSRESLKTEDTSNSDQEAIIPPPVTTTDETAGSEATTATTAQTTTTTGAGTTTQTATNTQTTAATNLTNVPILRNQENELPDYSRTHKGLLDNFESIPEVAKAEIERVMDQHHLTMVDMPANVETPVMKDKDGNYYRLDMAQRKLILDGQPQPGTNPVDYYTVQI